MFPIGLIENRLWPKADQGATSLAKILIWTLCLAFFVTLLIGCSPVSSVTKQAAFDLHCPADQIQIEKIQSTMWGPGIGGVYGATGCNQRASYMAGCSIFGCAALKQ